jgi:hypothetical protein
MMPEFRYMKDAPAQPVRAATTVRNPRQSRGSAPIRDNTGKEAARCLTMLSQSMLLTVSLGALTMLAGCGSTEQRASTAPDEAAAQTESMPPAGVAPAPAPSPAPSPAPTAAVPQPAARPATPPKPKPVQVVTIPPGTILSMSLSSALSSKTAQVGDPVKAMLTSDVQVDGRTVIASGTTVAGSVVKVVSGSDKIGGTPTLAVNFDRIELPGGQDVPISGEITQQGKSDNTRDTVKIVGGTAAGAIIGDKVIKGDKGKVIGGLLGGAVGAVAAKKTGTEVQMEEGTALTLVLDAPVEITK